MRAGPRRMQPRNKRSATPRGGAGSREAPERGRAPPFRTGTGRSARWRKSGRATAEAGRAEARSRTSSRRPAPGATPSPPARGARAPAGREPGDIRREEALKEDAGRAIAELDEERSAIESPACRRRGPGVANCIGARRARNGLSRSRGGACRYPRSPGRNAGGAAGRRCRARNPHGRTPHASSSNGTGSPSSSRRCRTVPVKPLHAIAKTTSRRTRQRKKHARPGRRCRA